MGCGSSTATVTPHEDGSGHIQHPKGPVVVKAALPTTFEGFRQFGTANLYLCINYLHTIAHEPEDDAPAHQLSKPYIVTIPEEDGQPARQHVVEDPMKELDSVWTQLKKGAAPKLRKVKRYASQSSYTVAPVPKMVMEVVAHSLPDNEETRQLLVRAAGLCVANEQPLRIARLPFKRELDADEIHTILRDKMPSKLLHSLCDLFDAINTSHSGRVTLGQLAHWVVRRNRHRSSFRDATDDVPLRESHGALADGVVFRSLARLVSTEEPDSFTPEEFVIFVYKLCICDDEDVSEFVFSCLSSPIIRAKKQSAAAAPQIKAPNLAESARLAVAEIEADSSPDRAINVNTLRRRFPILNNASMTHHLSNQALLDAMTKVYHSRLGSFSKDEAASSSVLCTLPEFQHVAHEAKYVLFDALRTRDALRAMDPGPEFWSEKRDYVQDNPEKKPSLMPAPVNDEHHHHIDLTPLVPKSAIPHRRISALAESNNESYDTPLVKAVERRPVGRRWSSAVTGGADAAFVSPTAARRRGSSTYGVSLVRKCSSEQMSPHVKPRNRSRSHVGGRSRFAPRRSMPETTADMAALAVPATRSAAPAAAAAANTAVRSADVVKRPSFIMPHWEDQAEERKMQPLGDLLDSRLVKFEESMRLDAGVAAGAGAGAGAGVPGAGSLQFQLPSGKAVTAGE